MSYDLYFTSPAITFDQFAGFFAGRPNYEVRSRQALYENKDTGVYFIVDHHDAQRTGPDLPDHTASASVNYFRPHYFGVEAAAEIAAFVHGFGFSIYDPQDDGMGNGPFTIPGLLKGWNGGNEGAVAAILRGEQAPKSVWTLPTDRLEAIWRWNFARAAVQDSLGEDIFVPVVFLLAVQRRVVTMTMWPDAISAVIPEVDFINVVRGELAPKTFLGRKKKDQMLVPLAELLTILEPYRTPGFALPAFMLLAPMTPEDLRATIRSLEPTKLTGTGLGFDGVLDEEIVAKAMP